MVRCSLIRHVPSAVLNFCRVYGGYRTWSGPFEVIVDAEAPQNYQGYSDSDPEVFDQVLFGRSDLPYGNHQIRIINTSQDPAHPILDIDYVSRSIYDPLR